MKLNIHKPGAFNIAYDWIAEEKYYLLKYYKNHLLIFTR